MLLLYRNVWIVLLQDQPLTAELTDLATGEPLPTIVSASIGEDIETCLQRARALVDLYRGQSGCASCESAAALLAPFVPHSCWQREVGAAETNLINQP